MKLRRIQTAKGYKIQALTSKRWVSLERISDLNQLAEKFSVEGDPRTDMLAVLRFGADGWVQLQSRLDKLTPLEETVAKVCLPFQPTSFRDFMLFEKHVIDNLLKNSQANPLNVLGRIPCGINSQFTI